MANTKFNHPIDLVYLWVNGNDPKWRAKKEKVTGVRDDLRDENCEGRYADNNELMYSLRSVEKYAPWINKIFIVTDEQTPTWLDVSNPKIKIVDHREILSQNALPTFNSTIIEHAIHRIPGLSEHFLYANDDMFINNFVRPEDFFTAEGMPIVRFNRRPFRKFTLFFKEKVLGKTISNYNRTIQTSARLVEQYFGRYIGHKTHHNIDAYRKSDYSETYELFKTQIEETFSNRVRSDKDIQRNLYSYVSIAQKKAKRIFVSQKNSFRLHIDKPSRYAKLEAYHPMLFCLNDSQYSTPEDRDKVKVYLESKFPDKSSFEK